MKQFIIIAALLLASMLCGAGIAAATHDGIMGQFILTALVLSAIIKVIK